ncbi:hypothetical protein F2Q70_00007336 [Brassica cretica]|uniref:Fructose-bisphosphatase n=1 Tax=Brassica cretica TaxID=69181 RepID=A0A8S9JL26_BRACR|nr:hypothetical protein F2Q68_00000406 [Brassica cretica]KAF2613299.1 hypothetical protein F2Q70_00007336 [Brassica cretica]
MLNYCSDNYIVGFHPLDGSSNIIAAVSTGSIFGVYSPYDSNEISAGKTSAMYGEFVLTQENIEIPRAGKIYSFNKETTRLGFTGSAKSKNGMLRLLYEYVPKSFMLNKVGEEGFLTDTPMGSALQWKLRRSEDAGEVLGSSHVPNISP